MGVKFMAYGKPYPDRQEAEEADFIADAVRGMLDGIAFVPQVQTQQFRDVGVVFDDEYASWRVHGRETL